MWHYINKAELDRCTSMSSSIKFTAFALMNASRKTSSKNTFEFSDSCSHLSVTGPGVAAACLHINIAALLWLRFCCSYWPVKLIDDICVFQDMVSHNNQLSFTQGRSLTCELHVPRKAVSACLMPNLLLVLQVSLAVMLPADPQPKRRPQLLMEGCSVRGGKRPVLGCRPPPCPGRRLTTTSRSPQLRLWPTQPLRHLLCKLCVPATPCWPTHTHHCWQTLGWVKKDYANMFYRLHGGIKWSQIGTKW